MRRPRTQRLQSPLRVKSMALQSLRINQLQPLELYCRVRDFHFRTEDRL